MIKGSPISSEFVAQICDMLILKKDPSFNQIFTKHWGCWYEIVKCLQKNSTISKVLQSFSYKFKVTSQMLKDQNSLLNHHNIETT